MSESARWERESIEDVHASTPHPEETVEFDMSAALDAAELDDPPEYDADVDDPDDDLDGIYDEEYPEHEPRAARALAGERVAAARESLSATRTSLASTGRRVGRWLHSLDRRPELEIGHGHGHDPVAELTAGSDPEPASDAPSAEWADASEPAAEDARFPTAARGYDRRAVDEHVAALEREVAMLRATHPEPPVSITEEIERIGEQTALILVVAHDQAHETARLAHEQAEREMTDARDQAQRITSDAERRLRELDEETEAVWRERERLLDDVRTVSATLQRLADDASERFPADESRGQTAPAEPEPAAS